MAATWKLEFPYRRSVGPVIGAFLTALRDRHVVGVRTANGRVLVPPFEYDPETGDALSDMVEVGSAGVVEHAAWVTEPLRTHPLDRPFAGGVTILHIIGAAFLAWALWLGFSRTRGKPVIDGVMALLTLAITYGLIYKFGASLPSQIVRALHVGFLCLVAGAMLALDWADAVMVEYHADDTSHESVIAEAASRGVGVIVKKALASGRLDPAAAIRFVTSNPHVATAVIGTRSIEHLRANIGSQCMLCIAEAR